MSAWSMLLQQPSLRRQAGDRELLFVGARDDRRLLDEITAAHWKIRFAEDPADIRRQRTPGEVAVGLLLVDSFVGRLRLAEDLIQLAGPQTKWVALLSKGNLDNPKVRSLISRAFFDFHTLPADGVRLSVTLGRAYGMGLVEKNEPRFCGRDGLREGILGKSPAIERLRSTITRVAAADAPILIAGESGTGKELAARAMHAASRRCDQPFVPVNCASIPSSLIQSEFFGYEKGAFTGATRRTIGKIEAANRGTIFLDEIGDLALDVQATLLRFLQEGTIQRLGSAVEVPVDVRVIAATHVDLRQAVREGRFREDLYYRIRVLQIDMPPLRERMDDIDILAQHFFSHFAADRQGQVKGFGSRALEVMSRYDWPGNVRELSNRIRHAIIMSENPLISPADLGLDSCAEEAPRFRTLDEARGEAEKNVIQSTLPRTRYNLSETARVLGVSRGTLYRLIDKHDIALSPQTSGYVRTATCLCHRSVSK